MSPSVACAELVEASDAGSVKTVTWLTAEITPPATAKYPATVTTAAGKATGAAMRLPPIPAKTNPIVLKVLKNFGVGAVALFIIF